MHLHTFLAEVHRVVRPDFYLEIGVQYGTSLQLAFAAEHAWGVDPQPITSASKNQRIFPMTSDAFFKEVERGRGLPKSPDHYKLPTAIDFGFIDGLHHFDQALNDFVNIAEHIAHDGVVIFDDILPRNPGEATREMCPGDWAGDVWKVSEILLDTCPDLRIVEVNTEPTGTLVVYGFECGPVDQKRIFAEAKKYWDTPVPESIISREHAYEPDDILAELREFKGIG
jgi:SAM-dependent methyltransferase